MQFRFSFKHMETSDALKHYAEEKVLDKINKFVTKPIEAHVIFAVDRHNHNAQVAITGGDGFNFQVEHTCQDMYGSIDRMVDKLDVKLKKQKERIKEHKGQKAVRELAELEIMRHSVEDDESIDAADVVKFESARRRGIA